MALIHHSDTALENPPPEAQVLLDTLEEDSPLSTKELKSLCDLRGRELAGRYNKAMGWLFARLQIVGFGEADDGAFPSLRVGATRLIYEDLWSEAKGLSEDEAWKVVHSYWHQAHPFLKHLQKQF